MTNNSTNYGYNIINMVHKSRGAIKIAPNSDVTPSAQSLGLCAARVKVEQFRTNVLRVVYDKQMYPLSLRYMIFLMLYTGCRISEALRVNKTDCSRNNSVRIRASKGSNDRIINLPKLDNMLLRDIQGTGLIFKDYDRFFIYRVCKQHGMVLNKVGTINHSVTHSFRAAYAFDMLEISETDFLKANVLGHRSIKSVEYYEKDFE